MKIANTGPIIRPARISGTSRPSGVSTVSAPAHVRPPAEVTSIMGVPENELTPKVRAALVGLMEEVGRLRQELEHTRKRIGYLEQLADQDSLVPVVNRRAFVRELSRMMSFAERYAVSSSILFFDLNKMKAINDTYGHAAGDASLSHVAGVLLENVRESDVVGRLGGDEFGVILAQADEAQANEKATLLATAVEQRPLVWEANEIRLSVSFGTYTFRGGEDTGHALHAADQAMYRHKKSAAGGS